MKRQRFLLLLAWSASYLAAQTPVDTTLSLQNIDIQGRSWKPFTSATARYLEMESRPSAKDQTVADAFRQIPSVVTDIEGGISFRGSNRPGLWINGIPYGVLEEYSGDMLIQLPASFFNQVVLSSMPPVDRVPDGDAGVLDLSSVAYSAADSPLQLTLGAGWHERYNAGAIVNLHSGRFSIVGKYDYRREYRERSFRKTTTNRAGTTLMNNRAVARPDVHLADILVRYDLDTRNRLTAYGLYNRMEYDRYGGIHNTKLNPAGEVQNNMLRHRYNNQQQEAYAAEASWNHRFDRPGSFLRTTFNYNNFGYDEGNDYQNQKPGTDQIVARDNLSVRQKKDNYYLSAGFTQMLDGNWLLKAGYIGRFRKETYRADANDRKNDAWVPNLKKSDEFTFYRRLQLVYASAEKEWGAWRATAGIQAEYAWQNVQANRNNRFHVYPRVQLAYSCGRFSQWNLSYIQRVIRPYGVDLNPFIDSSDATYIKQGNPDLKDEKIHSFEWAYAYTTAAFQVSPRIYYRNKADRIVDMAYQKDDETIWKKENIGHAQTIGMEVAAGWSPLRWLSVGAAGNLYRDEIDGRTIGYDRKKSLLCTDVKGNIRVDITSSTVFQLDGFYISDQLTSQGKIKSRYSVNAGLSQYFMHRRLQANLSIHNLFDSLEETTSVDTENLQIEQVRNRDPRVGWLTLTYRL